MYSQRSASPRKKKAISWCCAVWTNCNLLIFCPYPIISIYYANGIMEIFDSRYFYINKRLLCCIGVWPYEPRRKVIRAFWFCMIVLMSVPHVTSIAVNYLDRERLLENIVCVLHVFILFAKLTTLTSYEKKAKVMYEVIVNNWRIIVDEEEKKIFVEYSERGRFYTIVYSLFLTSVCVSFVLFPLVPEALHKIKILSNPQPVMFILNGEFLVDRESHYWQIYLFDCMTSLTVLAIYTPIDGMYRVCVEQCFALYAIITHRLLKPYAETRDDSLIPEDVSYTRILHIIKLHKKTIRFNQSLQHAYSACFLMILLAVIVEIPVGCNLLLISLHNPINCFRYSSILVTIFLHLLWICWPGQKLIDHSSRLTLDAYSSEWYRFSKRSRTLLRIFMMRCKDPVYITAGGLVNINMESYASTCRKALSYTAAVSSFQ